MYSLCLQSTILLSQQIVNLLFQLDDTINEILNPQCEVTLPLVSSSSTFLFGHRLGK